MTLAGPHWDALSPGERDDYNRRAKQMKGGAGGASAGPRDSHGIPLKDIHKRDREEKLRLEKKMRDVDELVVQDKNGNLEDKPFYVIHAAIFDKVILLFPGKGVSD